MNSVRLRPASIAWWLFRQDIFGYKCPSRLVFSISFLFYLIVFHCVVRAEQFPELDPPKIHSKSTVSEPTVEAIKRYKSFSVTPSIEWTLHKTYDDLHPDENEQQMLWFINRARQNPSNEGIWLGTMDEPDVAFARTYFNVDIDILQNEFAGYAPKAPAASDVRLYYAALAHSEDLIHRDSQDHSGQFDRVSDAGFHYLVARGNVFSYAKSALHGHAAFNIDWGPGDGTGMQPGRGHRMAIMSIDGDYTNVGIAAVSETDPSTNVGSLVVTQNFCNANAYHADHFNCFLIGTVWEDINDNGVYDPGEGIGGVTVIPDYGTYYAVTSESGGYALPVMSPGSYLVTFVGSSIPDGSVKTVTVGEESVLLDFILVSKDGSFLDVPTHHWAWSFIESLFAAKITAGCNDHNYCPDDSVTRAQMAVFLERGINGSDFGPPEALGIFNDVPIDHWASDWIEQLYADGITSGCGGGNYCPGGPVTRAQMAVFLLRALYGSDFIPPPAIGIFPDVPTGHWAADWIEQLYADGITSGCGGGNYCPGSPVTRAQMAVFLVRTFGLSP